MHLLLDNELSITAKIDMYKWSDLGTLSSETSL